MSHILKQFPFLLAASIVYVDLELLKWCNTPMGFDVAVAVAVAVAAAVAFAVAVAVSAGRLKDLVPSRQL